MFRSPSSYSSSRSSSQSRSPSPRRRSLDRRKSPEDQGTMQIDPNQLDLRQLEEERRKLLSSLDKMKGNAHKFLRCISCEIQISHPISVPQHQWFMKKLRRLFIKYMFSVSFYTYICNDFKTYFFGKSHQKIEKLILFSFNASER